MNWKRGVYSREAREHRVKRRDGLRETVQGPVRAGHRGEVEGGREDPGWEACWVIKDIRQEGGGGGVTKIIYVSESTSGHYMGGAMLSILLARCPEGRCMIVNIQCADQEQAGGSQS